MTIEFFYFIHIAGSGYGKVSVLLVPQPGHWREPCFDHIRLIVLEGLPG